MEREYYVRVRRMRGSLELIVPPEYARKAKGKVYNIRVEGGKYIIWLSEEPSQDAQAFFLAGKTHVDNDTIRIPPYASELILPEGKHKAEIIEENGKQILVVEPESESDVDG